LSRYKVTLQYDGAKFLGWQLQPKGRTVQGDLEKVLRKISNQKTRIPVHGAGRTDTGVHAMGQVAHFDFETRLSDGELIKALNGNLSLDCRIMTIEKVHQDFHARFDAVKRHYQYQCFTGNSLLFKNQAWSIPKIDMNELNQLASQLVGDHDFLSFSKYHEELKHTRCIIYKSEWTLDGKMVIFHITGNRFLHHMVRYLVGTMIAVIEKRLSNENYYLLLKNPQKDVRIFKAPPEGLLLVNVVYE